MRPLFFLLAALAFAPMLVGCVGLPNPQNEWTTNEGVGEPPVSHVQSSIDLTALEALDAGVPGHPPQARPAQHATETRGAEGHAGANGTGSERAADR